jgi:hypothetical protein
MNKCCKEIFLLALTEVLFLIEKNNIGSIETLKRTLQWAINEELQKANED